MRVLSYNIHKGIGGRDRRYRLERILDVIEHENPDFICLQEVDRNVNRSKFHDQPQLLIDRFRPAAHLYQLNFKVRQGGYGNMLLSRWPFASHHQLQLLRKHRKARGAQIAVIDTPEGPFQLVNWHLALDERTRVWQTSHVLEHHLFRESSEVPGMIIGDSNDWRNRLERGPFSEHGFTQITKPPSRFRSFPAWLPMGSLDKAFTRGPVVIREARVVKTPLSKQASDHLPLVIDFHLNGHAEGNGAQ